MLNPCRSYYLIVGACINGGLVITFLTFEISQDNIYLYFIFTGLWGVSDAVWQTQVNGKYTYHYL